MQNRLNFNFGNVTSDAQEMVEHYPVSTLLVAFGLGLSVGYMVASLFAEEDPETRAQRAARYGRQMLDSVGTVVPEAWRHAVQRR